MLKILISTAAGDIFSLQIQKRDEAIAQLHAENEELKTLYEVTCGQVAETEKVMASLKEKIEKEEERREEELSRCRKVIDELKQQLDNSEQRRVEQQRKVMVVSASCADVGIHVNTHSHGNGRQSSSFYITCSERGKENEQHFATAQACTCMTSLLINFESCLM